MNEGAERAVERRLDGRVVPINTHKNRCGPTLRCEEAPRAATPQTLFWGQANDKRRRAEAEQTKTGGRSPDQTKPDRPTERPTDPPSERTYLADRRLGGPLVLHGAAEVGLCVGCDGGRGGSRPSRPPHGHARAARGAAKVALHSGSGRQRSRNLMAMRT